MIITSNNKEVRIYEKTPDIMENNVITEYGIIKDILSFNITSEDIPKDLKIMVPGIGTPDIGKRFGKNSFCTLEFSNNIFIEFDNIDTALLYYKMFIKMRDGDVSDIQDEFPEFFV